MSHPYDDYADDIEVCKHGKQYWFKTGEAVNQECEQCRKENGT